MKTCRKCEQEKPLSNFFKDMSRSDGKHPWCKSCQTVDIHRSRILRDYGISVEEYKEVTSRPCGICRTTTKQRYLDHCHETGRVRGALCNPCNAGIGYLGDNLESVLRAVAYLA